MDEKRVLKVRLNAQEWQRIYDAKGEMSVSEFVRTAIQKFAETGAKETGEFVKLVQTIHANVDFLVVRIRALEQIENLLVEMLKILSRNPGSSLSDSDRKCIANLIWLLGQTDNQKGWNLINQASRNNPEWRNWLLENAKGKVAGK